MERIIVTDLTHFKTGKEQVCLAGITLDGNACIRPLMSKAAGPNPYLTIDYCKQHNMRPGSILEACFRASATATAPHVEDRYYDEIRKVGEATAAQFYEVLSGSSTGSLATAFTVPVTGKLIPNNGPVPDKSIVTLAVRAIDFSLDVDGYGKLRASFTDQGGGNYRSLPVTDLDVLDQVGSSINHRITPVNATNFFRRQTSIYLRVGLTRPYSSPDGRSGYWLQVNGIYSFPEFLIDVRRY